MVKCIHLDVSPENGEKKTGDNATFTCWINAFPEDSNMEWKFKKKPVYSFQFGKDFLYPQSQNPLKYEVQVKKISNGTWLFILHIYNLEPSDQGEYECLLPRLDRQKRANLTVVGEFSMFS